MEGVEEKANEARYRVRRWIRALGLQKIPPYLPNLITFSGVVLTAISAYTIATGHFSWAFLIYIASQFMDALDGAFAREYGLVSRAGAFLDSTTDRLNEFLWYLGMGWYFYSKNNGWAVLLLAVTMFFAFMVSYTRARIEGLGAECKVGFFTRLVRVYVMAAVIVFLIYSLWLALAFVGILFLGSLITSLQRFFCGIKILKQ